jgi:hypothetical protein
MVMFLADDAFQPLEAFRDRLTGPRTRPANQPKPD